MNTGVLEVKLAAYSGPLDLLLQLIRKNKIDIYDIPIADITDQYLSYLATALGGEMDMDIASAFILMAATLLDIKARMLLPAPPKSDGEDAQQPDADPRASLVERLIAYELCQKHALFLAGMQVDAVGLAGRRRIPEEVRLRQAPVDYAAKLSQADVYRLRDLYITTLRRKELRADHVRMDFGHIQQQDIDMDAETDRVRKMLHRLHKCPFTALTSGLGRESVIVAFLVLLELMKMGECDAEQSALGGEIIVGEISERAI